MSVPQQQDRAQDQLLLAHLPSAGKTGQEKEAAELPAWLGLQRHDVLAPTRLLRICKLILPMHRLGQEKSG
ncbi:unnamed protein product [Clonostachys byssicola]|uniref:Uncharacterized protein n=1 Tax=Clonostachys byssicola TaxID=160290 RepID=A0A9N9UTP3_9HYPO|nr:unnamed protein product [Clonostachys byssicola]